MRLYNPSIHFIHKTIAMRILKFGGSSVAGAERIKRVLPIIEQAQARGARAVVCSAFGGVTDALIDMAHLAAEGNEEYAEAFHNVELQHIKTNIFSVIHFIEMNCINAFV